MKRIIAIAVVAAALGLAAGCGASAAATSHPSAATSAPAAPAAAPMVTDPSGVPCSTLDAQGYCPGDDPAPATTAPAAQMSCTTVLDPNGYQNGPLTVDRAIGFLSAMLLEDGITDIPTGTPSADDATILDDMATELGTENVTINENQMAQNKLLTDAQQFQMDEQGYNPDNPSTVDLAEAQPLINDILALQKDCPAGLKMGVQMSQDG